ncbi:MAG: hypothetical protein R3B57_12270 [Phycisphaerales bacterium]
MRAIAVAAILSVTLAVGACAPKTVNVRSRLLEASKAQDPHFPDEASLQLTHFAYIGDIETADGRFHVVYANAVIRGMLAPRGQAWLALYDEDQNFVRRYELLGRGRPLWCEGGKIYWSGFTTFGLPHEPSQLALFGPPDCPQSVPTGNVADFSQGLDHGLMRREFKYGSSGGIADDPLAGLAAAITTPDSPATPD